MKHDNREPYYRAAILVAAALATGGTLTGCRSPTAFRHDADRAAHAHIEEAQRAALGRTQPCDVEPPSETLRRRLLLDQNLPHADPASLGSGDVKRIPQWPDPTYGPPAPPVTDTKAAPAAVLKPSLLDALQIAARGSREYQSQKEQLFEAALQLDLEKDAFRQSWAGVLESTFSGNNGGEEPVRGVQNTAGLNLKRKLMSGGTFALDLGLDLVKLLTQDKSSALGLLADTTLSMPLLRGSGRFVVAEPLTQAERNVVYAIHTFERFKRTFAVQIAAEYLGVLQQIDQVNNARDNYERLVLSTRRARRLADAGQLPEIQVDQARQDELRARNRWISAQLDYERRLDAFKVLLGLPADAAVELDSGELARLAEGAVAELRAGREAAVSGTPAVPAANAPVVLRELSRTAAGGLAMTDGDAVRLALDHRLDLRTRIGKVMDAQRSVAVAADQLRADVALLGRASAGERRGLGDAAQGDAKLNPSDGHYSATLKLDLPLERTAERNQYRLSLVRFEKAVRDVQELEDRIKLEVRNALRALIEGRETVAIQETAVEVARRRRDSTTMFLEAGRAQIRDVLEAEEALVSAQNALSAALVGYRVGELQLQRDMGVLEIDENGLWKEYVAAPGGDEAAPDNETGGMENYEPDELE